MVNPTRQGDGFWSESPQPTRKSPEVVKTDTLAQSVLKAEQAAALEPNQEARFKSNYEFILNHTDLDHVDVQDGRLVDGVGSEEGKALITQTYRQAWGKLIDADHGYGIKENALYKLDKLRAHIGQHFPELLTHVTLKPAGKNPTPELQKQQRARRVEIDLKVREVRQKNLKLVPLSEAESGVNPTKFAFVGGEKVAVDKSEKDLSYGSFVAVSAFGLKKEDIAKLAGFNESLASELSLALGSKLPVPLAVKEGQETVHAFAEETRSLKTAQILDTGILDRMPQVASQRFVFLQILTRNTDCHRGNILLSKSNEPIGIDFGRALFPDPNNVHAQLRGAYFKFSCLDQPVNAEDQAFFTSLDVEKVISGLSETLKAQHVELANHPQIGPIIGQELNLLKARLIMVQEAMKLGCTQRELLALDLPPLSKGEYQQIKSNVDPNGGYMGWRWAARDVMREKGFMKAWKMCVSESPWHNNPQFDAEQFREVVHNQLEAIQKSETPIYGEREKEVYRAAKLDIS